MKYTNKTEEKINMEMIKTKSKPGRVSYGGKGVAAVISATRIRFALGETIYIVWVSGKKVKTLFFYTKKKQN